MKQEKNVEVFSEKKNNLYDSQRIIKSTNISQTWIKEIIQIVVFHHVLASIQNFDFQNFWNSVPNSRSNARQVILSGTGFSKMMVWIKVSSSRIYSYILSRSENFIHIG